MAGFGAILNPEWTEPWVAQIGKYILNFGAIEHISFLWIVELEEAEVELDDLSAAPFSRRVNRILSLVKKRALSPALTAEIRDAWRAATRLSKLRNDVAHSPIIFGWHDQDRNRPPDFIGCFNMRRLQEANHALPPLVEFSTLHEGVDEAAALPSVLIKLLNRVVRELHSES